MARAARAQKGDAGFWEMHDRLFNAAQLEDGDLELIARAAGLDVKPAMLAMKNQIGKKEVEADRELSDEVEVQTTPQLFVNGRRLIGEQPYEKLNAIVEEETHKAEALLKSGVEATGLYDWFIKDGLPGDPMRKIIPWPPNAPSRGSTNGPIIIQEFISLPCVVCKRADPILDEVMKAYPGQVRLVWRDMPATAEAQLAAESVHQGFADKGADAFWKMEGRLASNQTILTRPDLEAAGTEVSLDADKLKKALDARTHRPTVDIDSKAAKDASLVSSPTFVIGTYVFTGIPSLARFLRYAGKALAEAPPPPRSTPQAPGTRPSGPSVAPRFSWVDLVIGKGPPAEPGDMVTVHWRARLAEGGEFDNTYKRGAVSFMIGSGAVVGGLDRATVGMRVGGKRRITIPPELGFGNHGIGKTIPVNAVIIMEAELLKITPK
jgi:protein-disulfide isomerase